jgi:hypothetical protein
MSSPLMQIPYERNSSILLLLLPGLPQSGRYKQDERSISDQA